MCSPYGQNPENPEDEPQEGPASASGWRADQPYTRLPLLPPSVDLSTISSIEAIRLLSAHTAEYVRAELPKIYSHELVNLLFEPPYRGIAEVIDARIAETRPEHIDPALAADGWSVVAGNRIRREYAITRMRREA